MIIIRSKALWAFVMLWCNVVSLSAQNISIPGGIIKPGMTTCFSFTTSGLPTTLVPYNPGAGFFINNLCINVITNHPQTIEISLVSPAGTVLILSSFNGSGTGNYVNTCFVNPVNPLTPSIAVSPPPFTGNYLPQDTLGFSVFNGQNPNGIWRICFRDTLTDTTSYPPGGPPGLGASSSASGSMGFGNGGASPCTQTLGYSIISYCLYNGGTSLLNANTWFLLNPVYSFNGALLSSPWVSYPGIYTVTGTHPVTGCLVTGTIEISPSPPNFLGPDITTTVCAGMVVNLFNLISILLPSNVSIAYQSWNYTNYTPVPNPSAVIINSNTTFVLQAQNYAGCWDDLNFTINVIPAPNLGPDQILQVCNNSSYNLSALFNTTGLTTNWYFNNVPISNPTAITQSGIYTLIGANGSCKDTVNVDLTLIPRPSLGADQTTYICNGSGVNLNSMYNLNGLTFTWTKGGIPVTNPTQVTIAGTYTLIAYNSFGCSDTALVYLYIQSIPNPGPDQFITACQGAVINLNSYFNLSGLTASWTQNGMPVADPTNINSSGTYDLLVLNIAGCSAQAQFLLSFLSLPIQYPDTTIQVCAGVPVNLLNVHNTSGLNLYWSIGGLNLPNPSGVTTAGNYQLVVTNSFGCSTQSNILLNLNMPPALGPDIPIQLCAGSVIDLNSLFSLGSLTANWTYNGLAISQIQASTAGMAGSYELIVTNSLACSDTVLVALTVSQPIYLGPDLSHIECYASGFDIAGSFNTAGLNNTFYLGSNVISNPAWVTSSGLYMLISSNAACSDTAFFDLTISQSPALGPDQNLNICTGATIDLNALYSLSGLSTNWSFNSAPISSFQASVANVSGNYQLIAFNANGCSDTVDVNLTTAPQINLGSDQTILDCGGSAFDLSNLFNTSGLNSIWSLNGSNISNPSSVNSSGQYMLVASNNGCIDTALVNLTISTNPVLGPDINLDFCDGNSIDLNTLFNTSTLSTSWTFAGLPVANISAVNGPGVYSLVANNSDGCSSTANANLIWHALPSPGNNQTVDMCDGQYVDLNSFFNLSGLFSNWTLNGSPVTNAGIIGNAGTYFLQVSDGYGCANQATLQLNIQPKPALGADLTQDICQGTSIDLNSLFNTIGLNTSWTQSGVPVSNPNAINTAGMYQLIVSSGFGCLDTAIVTINVLLPPLLGNMSITICDNESTDLTSLYSINGNANIWTMNSQPIANPTSISTSGIYNITSTNAAGCSSSSDVTVISNPVNSLGSDQGLSACTGQNTDLGSVINLSGLSSVWTQNGINVPDPSAVNVAGIYQIIASNSFGCSDTANVNLIINQSPDLGSDMSYTLCQWRNLNLEDVYQTSNMLAQWAFNGISISNITSVHDSGTYAVFVTDQHGCYDDAIVTISNLECDCDAEFSFLGNCFQEPFQFAVLADSLIENSHWNFHTSGLPDSYLSESQIKFYKAGFVTVTLEVQLTCGLVSLSREILVEDCSQGCDVYLPNAFTPNNDGHNDYFRAFTACQPEEFELFILDKFGKVIYETKDHEFQWPGTSSAHGIYSVICNYRMPYQGKKSITNRLTIIR